MFLLATEFRDEMRLKQERRFNFNCQDLPINLSLSFTIYIHTSTYETFRASCILPRSEISDIRVIFKKRRKNVFKFFEI